MNGNLAPRRLLLLTAVCATLAAPAAYAQKKPRTRTAPAKQEQTPKPDAQKKPEARQVPPSSILVRWQGKPGVTRYRLQLATDEKFEDIVFDQAVEGRQYVVTGLAKGNYFWRVAPAVGETSPFYSTPERVAVTESASLVATPAGVLMPDESAGWRTATGEVARVVPARLRQGPVVDFIGVGADGRVFALDGANGVSLWTMRYAPAAGSAPKSPFAPVLVKKGEATTDVIAGVEGGVRSLRGDTGKEGWRARLEGRAASGAAADLNEDGASELFVVTADPDRLYVLDAGSGRIVAEQKLDAEAVGAPFPVTYGGARGVALAFRDGRVEIRGVDGKVIRSEKLEGDVTTGPLVVAREGLSIMVVGTDKGLAAMSIPDLKVLGRIVAEDDAPRGVLAAVDVDRDGSTEIVMVTRKGRVALVTTTDGNVKWHAEGATDASMATFADLNGDGTLDVIVPGGSTFALGFSGRDGSLVMRVEEGGRAPAGKAGAGPRALVVAPTQGGGGLLVGSDPARVGLRAVELPKGAVNTAAN